MKIHVAIDDVRVRTKQSTKAALRVSIYPENAALHHKQDTWGRGQARAQTSQKAERSHRPGGRKKTK